MNLNLIKDIKSAYTNLKPGSVRELAEKNVAIGIVTSSDDKAEYIRSFLGPTAGNIERVSETAPAENFPLLLVEPGLPRPQRGYEFRFRDPDFTIESVLDAHQELEVALCAQLSRVPGPCYGQDYHPYSTGECTIFGDDRTPECHSEFPRTAMGNGRIRIRYRFSHDEPGADGVSDFSGQRP